MSGVGMLHVFERLMEIHSNPPILYYGFKLWFQSLVLQGLYLFIDNLSPSLRYPGPGKGVRVWSQALC